MFHLLWHPWCRPAMHIYIYMINSLRPPLTKPTTHGHPTWSLHLGTFAIWGSTWNDRKPPSVPGWEKRMVWRFVPYKIHGISSHWWFGYPRIPEPCAKKTESFTPSRVRPMILSFLVFFCSKNWWREKWGVRKTWRFAFGKGNISQGVGLVCPRSPTQNNAGHRLGAYRYWWFRRFVFLGVNFWHLKTNIFCGETWRM